MVLWTEILKEEAQTYSAGSESDGEYRLDWAELDWTGLVLHKTKLSRPEE
jgi:hypothetical protein